MIEIFSCSLDLRLCLDPAFSQTYFCRLDNFLRLEFFKVKLLAFSLLCVGVIKINIFLKR